MNRTIIVTLFCVLCSISISAQGTEFSYQGSLKDRRESGERQLRF